MGDCRTYHGNNDEHGHKAANHGAIHRYDPTLDTRLACYSSHGGWAELSC